MFNTPRRRKSKHTRMSNDRCPFRLKLNSTLLYNYKCVHYEEYFLGLL